MADRIRWAVQKLIELIRVSIFGVAASTSSAFISVGGTSLHSEARPPCIILLQYLYYQVLLLISTGTVLVYMYWYCRSIAQVHACERPTGYIKYESLVRMTLNPTHESIPLDSMCAT